MAGYENLKISLLDAGNGILFEKKITSLPLKDEVIISKSIEFFDDPEPCMIHRSAVMKRLFVEMAEYFEGLRKADVLELQWEELPDFIKHYIHIGKPVDRVLVRFT